MADQTTPIDLQQADVLLAQWLQAPVRCCGIRVLKCGEALVLHLSFDRPPHGAVLRVDPDPKGTRCQREANRLEYLHRHTRLPCPRIYRCDESRKTAPYGFLLTEFIPERSLEAAPLTEADRFQVETQLAEALLELHSHTRESFGEIDKPGPIGWAETFIPRRLVNFREDMVGRVSDQTLSDIDRAIAAAPEVLDAHGPPTLVHGDLWPDNIRIRRQADGWQLSGIVDVCSLHYADVEYELAYLQWCQAVGDAFFQRYTRERPWRAGYERRRLYYWLHFEMLHLWLAETNERADNVARAARELVRE